MRRNSTRSAVLSRFWALALAVAAVLAIVAAPASATTVTPYSYSGKFFDGTGSSTGVFSGNLNQITIDQASGDVYVTDTVNGEGTISKFTGSGLPKAFTDPALAGANGFLATGSISQLSNIVLDQSSGPSKGNIYVSRENFSVEAYTSTGAPLGGTTFPLGGFGRNCDVAVDPEGDLWVAESTRGKIVEFNEGGSPTGQFVSTFQPCRLVIDGEGNFYVAERVGNTSAPGQTRKYDKNGVFQYMLDFGVAWGLAVDYSNNDVYVNKIASGSNYEVAQYDSTGLPKGSFGLADVSKSYLGLQNARGIAVNSSTHEVYVASRRTYNPGNRRRIEIFAPGEPKIIPTVRALNPTPVLSGATLRATVDADNGGSTTECLFQWGTTTNYGNTVPCSPAGPFGGIGPNEVTAVIGGLTKGTRYNYRLVSKNANGIQARSNNIAFRPQGPPTVSAQAISQVNSDSARLSAQIDPNGGDTTYTFEYGPEPCSTNACTVIPAVALPNALGVQSVSQLISGLTPGGTYWARVVATNLSEEVEGPDYEFSTFAPDPGGEDPCGNALVRRQTGAVPLLDCRAYELVSAADSGGYDVRSDLVPGQVPLVAQPRATDRLLYSLHYGTIPGIAGSPPNFGDDPHVATRGSGGWSTKYVGIPASGTPSLNSFGSPLAGAGESLSAFAFGGPSLCDPCFGDGSRGIPVRLPDGTLEQGMAGSLDPGPADQDGFVGRQLSADGTHLVFGSASQYEGDGNSNGDVSIYMRDLTTGTTEVISKGPGGANLACLSGAGTCQAPGNPHGIAALDVSADGSRAVVAQRVGADAAGNDLWHPYMYVAGSAGTIDLAPTTTSGVLYSGMSGEGTDVFFTSHDQLTGDDNDSSADLFRADVSGLSASLTRLSAGTGSGDTDACDPVAGASGENWNEAGELSPENCSVTTIAGGGGVASEDGTVYFFSPEQLDTPEGTLNEANLYVVAPGSQPEFVASLEPDNVAVSNALMAPTVHSYGDFQVTPDGEFAAFASEVPLTGFPNFGFSAVFRHETGSDALACASCSPTGAASTGEVFLSSYGLNITDDGRVFFTTPEALVLRDTNNKKDAYEWNEGTIGLVSTGKSIEDSGLVTAGADGTDAFFYTHDVLVPGDANGFTMKIYSARVGGGYLFDPPTGPCQASDECHGPGTQPGPPPDIGTFKGTGGQFTAGAAPRKCKGKKVRRRGRCVKPASKKHRAGKRSVR